MGLDIYSGTLTRYYSHNWKNSVQIMAQQRGIECRMVDTFGNKIKPVADKEELEKIHNSVLQWIENLANSINLPFKSSFWDESANREYFTDKPDWEAQGALVLVQACRLLNRPLPK